MAEEKNKKLAGHKKVKDDKETKKYCSDCGRKITNDDKFCSGCGKQLDESIIKSDYEEESSGNDKETPRDFRFTFFICLVIAEIIAFWLFAPNSVGGAALVGGGAAGLAWLVAKAIAGSQGGI